jgi:SAM-dependent methyltransferase
MPAADPEAGPAWSERAQLDPLAAVLDPSGGSARKNQLIDAAHRSFVPAHLSGGGSRTLLDFGCGTGRMQPTVTAAGWRYVGVEATREMAVEAGLTSTGVALFDGLRVPVADAAVDAILVINVLQYFPIATLDAVLAELARVLRPAGQVVAIEQVGGDGLRRGHGKAEYAAAFARASLPVGRAVPLRRGDSTVMRVALKVPSPTGLCARLLRLEARARPKPAPNSYVDTAFVATRA